MRNANPVLCAVGLVCLTAIHITYALPPDAGLKARQLTLLRNTASNAHAAAGSTTEYAYSAEKRDAVRTSGHAAALVARLELHRRGASGGMAPEAAAPIARHLADALARFVGMNGKKGPWHWDNAGTPSVMAAAGALAYALHRYGADWPAEVKESIRRTIQDASWPGHDTHLVNGRFDVVAAELLAGEALGRPDLWARGLRHFEGVFTNTMRHGGHEMNAPLYSAWHYPPLIFLQALRDAKMRAKARILLEYVLLVQGHLYLPGGALGAPQSRDYAGGTKDGGDRAMLPLLWLLVGDPALEPRVARAYSLIAPAAATDYAVPEIIRSVFLEKGDGYTFWTHCNIQQGSGRTPYSVYKLGLDGAQVTPWQAVVLPGGAASIGAEYGYRLTGIQVTSGVYVRRPAGGFAVLYQYQPCVRGDTDYTLSPLSGAGLDTDANDFTSELFDYERMVYDRTLLALWDPTPRGKPKGIVRTHQDTRVHLPDWQAEGGETRRAGAWRIGRLGDVYVAYLPLGKLAEQEHKTNGNAGKAWTYLRLDGPSGGITELATRREFPTIDHYARDLAARHVAFSADPLRAEVDARRVQDGERVRIRLEYQPERRFVDEVEVPVKQALGHGLMKSPWTRWDAGARRLTVARSGYPTIVYDWNDGVVSSTPR
ncbi:MAG: hypothetical protein JXR37_14955 [Kiritimatiellae bacterium]|nr:hypothetical protein [Kiritimatiellia bacterium]